MQLILLSAFSLVLLLLGRLPAVTSPPKSDQSFPQISLESIYSSDHSWTASVSAQTSFTLLVSGDAMLGRTINSRSVAKNDFIFPFQPTMDLLKSADITFINLETPLIPDCPISNAGTVFCGSSRFITGLSGSGVDIASLANNHSFDFYDSGFATTAALLSEAGIQPVYPGHPAKITVKNTGITFLSYNDIWSRSKSLSHVDPERMVSEISAARPGSDLIIVMFHWGNEYTEKITDRQKYLARLAVDSGADLIIGNHPHWIQTSEIYRDKLITYSLGNYIFDQYWSQKTREGLLGKYLFSGSHLIDVNFLPVYQETNGQTVQISRPVIYNKL